MPDLTEREKQVVAWLRGKAVTIASANTAALCRTREAQIMALTAEPYLARFTGLVADAIERGEHLRGGNPCDT